MVQHTSYTLCVIVVLVATWIVVVITFTSVKCDWSSIQDTRSSLHSLLCSQYFVLWILISCITHDLPTHDLPEATRRVPCFPIYHFGVKFRT